MISIILFSDGVGRSGTFITIHAQLERLKTEGVVDFFQFVKSARTQRPGFIADVVSGLHTSLVRMGLSLMFPSTTLCAGPI